MYIKNAAILLFTGAKLDRVVLLKHRHTNELMIPGGKIDKTDKGPFAAMKREFKEDGWNKSTMFMLDASGKLEFNYGLNHTDVRGIITFN